MSRRIVLRLLPVVVLLSFGAGALAQRAVTLNKAARIEALYPDYDTGGAITAMRIQAKSTADAGFFAEYGAQLECVPADITSTQRTACSTCLNALRDCWNTKAGL